MEFHFCIATMTWTSRRSSVCGNKSENRDAPIILYASRDLQLMTQNTDIRVTDLVQGTIADGQSALGNV